MREGNAIILRKGYVHRYKEVRKGPKGYCARQAEFRKDTDLFAIADWMLDETLMGEIFVSH